MITFYRKSRLKVGTIVLIVLPLDIIVRSKIKPNLFIVVILKMSTIGRGRDG